LANFGGVALLGLRQICRFDYFKGGKFGSLGNLDFIALNSATKPYISRWRSYQETELNLRITDYN